MFIASITIIIIYVDDVMIFCRTQEQIKDINTGLKSEYSIKNFGELKHCLDIKIYCKRSENLIMMNQQAYIRRLAEKFGLQNARCSHASGQQIKAGQDIRRVCAEVSLP